MNDKFMPAEDARVSVSSPGFFYGWGLFETMRSYNGKIVYLDAHLQRLEEGCLKIGIELKHSAANLKQLVKKAVRINGFKDAYVKLILWKDAPNTGLLILAKNYQPPPLQNYKEGFSAAVSSLRQAESLGLARIKTISRLLYELSLKEADSQGFDEALILNNRGYICEATRSSIFLVKNSELFTPSLDCGCLGGITRKVIFDFAKVHKIKAYECNLTIRDLFEADEAFLTNSLMGVMPLVSVEKQQIGKGAKYFKLTKFFMEKYKYLLKNGT